MKRLILAIGIILLMAVSCREPVTTGRDTLESVKAIAADTAGVFSQIVRSGQVGAPGSIAIIGEPADGILLSRQFLTQDRLDNIDGREVRDSLPDFSGETFHVVLDDYNVPYAHFLSYQGDTLLRESLDSLRELAVQHALYAWKKNAKIMIFSSPLQAEYGLFDVDTLRKMAGASTFLLSPLETMFAEALEGGARKLAVWASRDLPESGVYEAVFARMAPKDATLEVLSPEAALDVRTELRNLLRQYQLRAERLDALLIDSYSVNLVPLESELRMIRRQGTDEDERFDRMLSPMFRFIDAAGSVTKATSRILREENLFTHRVARPEVRYYQTLESEEGNMAIVEVGARFVKETYVPDLD